MSLVGNLADLGLGDIFQIVSMARRSGTLQLTTPTQAGEIVFRLGKVVAVYRATPRSVGEALIEAGLLTPAVYQDMLVKQGAGVIGANLFAAANLQSEALTTVLEDLLKRVIYGMFEWKEGTFSFVLEEQPDPWRGFSIDGPRVVVESGLNPQYLAIEGARLRDEHGKAESQAEASGVEVGGVGGPGATVPGSEDDFSQLHFEPAMLPVDLPPVAKPLPAAAAESLPEADEPAAGSSDKIIPFPGGRVRREAGKPALALARRAEPEQEPEPPVHRPQPDLDADLETSPEPEPEPEPPRPLLEPLPSEASAPTVIVKAGAEAESEPRIEPALGAHVSPWALLLVDDDPQVLEHLTQAFGPRFASVATAGTVAEALGLLRSAPTGVLVLSDLIIARSDGEGILGGVEILEYVRQFWSNAPVVLFTDYQNEEAEARAESLGVTAQLMKPRKAQIYGDGRRGTLTPPMRDFIGRLEDVLRPYIEGTEQPAPRTEPPTYDLRRELDSTLTDAPAPASGVELPPRVASAGELGVLRSMLAELRDPQSRDSVTLLVLRFASSLFERGALFLATRRTFVGLGGFAVTEASDKFVARVRQIQIPVDQESVFTHVVRFRTMMRGPLADSAGNRLLLAGLGGPWHTHETVAAPLISGDRVAALLFGDNPSGRPLGNTDGLEIFLQQAGLVMERALLERKLEESRRSDPLRK